MSKIKKAYNRILEVSDDAKQITLPDSRYYRRNGEYYPSITYVLGYYPKGKFFEDWLKKEGIKPSFYEMLDEPDPVLQAEKINRIGAIFGKPEWYVDNNPRTCAELLKLGMATLLIASPYLVRPEWSNMKVIKEWDVLVEELDTQALKAAEKTWRE